MELLIDGYNLLHATDLFGRGAAAGTLEGSRDALLDFLGRALTPSERRRATIVFDAAAAPPGLPDRYSHEGVTVRFARGYPDADAMLETLIESRTSGKGLLVISSDHRVQRAARRRGARTSDADAWYRELRGRRADEPAAAEPRGAGLAEDADRWVAAFSDEATLAALADEQAEPPPPSPPPTKPPASGDAAADPTPTTGGKRRRKHRPATRRGDSPGPFGEGVFEGFPPGYADDLADELESPKKDSDSPSEPPAP